MMDDRRALLRLLEEHAGHASYAGQVLLTVRRNADAYSDEELKRVLGLAYSVTEGILQLHLGLEKIRADRDARQQKKPAGEGSDQQATGR